MKPKYYWGILVSLVLVLSGILMLVPRITTIAADGVSELPYWPNLLRSEIVEWPVTLKTEYLIAARMAFSVYGRFRLRSTDGIFCDSNVSATLREESRVPAWTDGQDEQSILMPGDALYFYEWYDGLRLNYLCIAKPSGRFVLYSSIPDK